jgi:hypothetical protein
MNDTTTAIAAIRTAHRDTKAALDGSNAGIGLYEEAFRQLLSRHLGEPGTAPEPRFLTDPIFVTGHTPAELESEAIAHAALLTGWPAGQLAVAGTYQLRSVLEVQARNAGALTVDQLIPLTEDQRAAVADEHPLYASITVSAYGEPAS